MRPIQRYMSRFYPSRRSRDIQISDLFCDFFGGMTISSTWHPIRLKFCTKSYPQTNRKIRKHGHDRMYRFGVISVLRTYARNRDLHKPIYAEDPGRRAGKVFFWIFFIFHAATFVGADFLISIWKYDFFTFSYFRFDSSTLGPDMSVTEGSDRKILYVCVIAPFIIYL
jgi:hypothetical protein